MTKSEIKAAAVRLGDRVRHLEVELDRRTVTWMAVLAGTLGLAVGAVGTCGGEAVADERVPSAAPVVVTSPESVIELRFTEHEQLSGRGLDARVQGRVAVLTGTVKTRADRALAARLALVSGVDRVDNQLTLEPPPPPPSRQARANPPLTRDEREQRKRPGTEAPAPVGEADVVRPAAAPLAGVRPAGSDAVAGQGVDVKLVAPAPPLAPAVTGAMSAPPGPATGVAASALAPATSQPPPSPSQILGEEVSPSPPPALSAPSVAADGQ